MESFESAIDKMHEMYLFPYQWEGMTHAERVMVTLKWAEKENDGKERIWESKLYYPWLIVQSQMMTGEDVWLAYNPFENNSTQHDKWDGAAERIHDLVLGRWRLDELSKMPPMPEPVPRTPNPDHYGDF